MSIRPKKGQIICSMVPLKDIVVFPHMVSPLLVGRTSSLAAIEEAVEQQQPLFLCMQRSAETETPNLEDLHEVGVTANVIQTVRLPDGSVKVIVEGVARARLSNMFTEDDALMVLLDEIPTDSKKSRLPEDALTSVVSKQFDEYAQQGQRLAPEIVASLQSIDDPNILADMICAHLSIKSAERQELLEMDDLAERFERISVFLARELELLSMEQDVRDRVRDQMERGQREYFLTEQMRVIQRELGSGEFGGDDVQDLRELIEKTKMPKEVKAKAQRELTRFERMPMMTPESAITQTYLEWLTEVPWDKRTRDKLDLAKAEKILNEDHYGLIKVKERILEFLAARKLSKSKRGPVMCLVGPPGVGKTSLGESIARAMGRKFARVSLGGVRDEAEIRGHRRTYIGALPGRIIQSMKKCGVKNPVFMLDEIDKMSMDFRGDPSSALLEVLDPEQNKNFSDHYLEVDFDLQEVFFVTTANNEYEIPEPLLDRMEIIRIPGYTPLEKEKIARNFLIPRQLEQAGVSDKQVKFRSEGLQTLIHRYTMEAGVRELDRQIGSICRKVARKVVSAKKDSKPATIKVTEKQIFKLLGPPIYSDIGAATAPAIGVSLGLAWTSFGGDTLPIETTVMKGKGDLRLTGQLGEVMQESAQAAYTYLRANAKKLQIPVEFWKSSDIHVHLPEGAIPKDGPSAGGALAVSMLSGLRKQAPHAHLAMTGEITLQGRMLPVGGIKEKMLAAHRAKVTRVLLPKENEKDLIDIPKEVRDDIEFILVETLDEVIARALPKPKPIRKAKRPTKKSKAKAKKKK
ncbi:MAG: endopeptidase La [Candidatus Hydrogenedentota bacterium]